jgi:carboxypeptidase D
VSTSDGPHEQLLIRAPPAFSVDGTAIPEVSFDLGESYAGLLPIDGANDTNQLFYWFFPSENPASENEILIWLTGGV